MDLHLGPIQVTLDYALRSDRRAAMEQLLKRLRKIRLRAGAEAWTMGERTGNPNCLRESYWVSSWAGYLRLQERLTAEDRKIEAELARLAGEAPQLHHQIGDRG